MTLLLAGGRRRVGGSPPPSGDTTPYAMPTVAPWNVPTPAITPTYDGSGVSVHPSVLDFGASPWNGWRYWMAMTPYPGTNATYENPSIIVSNDGYTWQEPTGITNPIDPWPGGATYNSDPDLVHDPDTGTLYCYWRRTDTAAGPDHILVRSSTDGVTWSTATDLGLNTRFVATISPSVIRRATGDWWLFVVNRSGSPGLTVYRSASPTTGWAVHDDRTFRDSGMWHIDVLWDGSSFRALKVNISDPYNIHAMSSADGVAWATSTALMTSRSGLWDAKLYRPTFTIKDADWFRVWYSAVNGHQWRIGYTQMPRNLWPAPPA